MNQTTFQILAVLRAERRDAGEILDCLRAVLGDGGVPAMASFYRAIKRALDDGLIHIVGTASPTEGPGRRSQLYQITARGVERAEVEATRLRSLAALALGDQNS